MVGAKIIGVKTIYAFLVQRHIVLIVFLAPPAILLCTEEKKIKANKRNKTELHRKDETRELKIKKKAGFQTKQTEGSSVLFGNHGKH